MKCRAVIIDDSAFQRKMIRDVLEGAGVEVLGEASDGLEGMVVIKKLKPNLITLDHMMPNCTGVELLEKLKAERIIVRTVFISAVADDKMKSKLRTLGVSAIHDKPFNDNALVASIDRYYDVTK